MVNPTFRYALRSQQRWPSDGNGRTPGPARGCLLRCWVVLKRRAKARTMLGGAKADESTIQPCRLAPDIQDPHQSAEDDHRPAQSWKVRNLRFGYTPRRRKTYGCGNKPACSEIESAGFRVIRSSNPGYLRRAEIVIRPARAALAHHRIVQQAADARHAMRTSSRSES
jgi:hypothetical protein